jgi:hypothetical protein
VYRCVLSIACSLNLTDYDSTLQVSSLTGDRCAVRFCIFISQRFYHVPEYRVFVRTAAVRRRNESAVRTYILIPHATALHRDLLAHFAHR